MLQNTTRVKNLNNFIELSMLGRANIQIQLDSDYRQSINEHNEQVLLKQISRLFSCVFKMSRPTILAFSADF